MSSTLLPSGLAARVRALEFRAKRAVDSLRSGIHRSRHHGASMEFAEHREYRPGDDPRRLDWRAYARSGRPVIRRFEQEAQLLVTLLLDGSASMNWAGIGEPAHHKGDYAATVLAAAGHLLLEQGDGVRVLGTADDALLPFGSGRASLPALLHALASSKDGAGTLEGALETLVHAQRPSALIVASDFLEFADGRELPWSALCARGREIIALHVVHPHEATPPELEAQFEGLENEGGIEADLSLSAKEYRSAFERFATALRERCTAARVRYVRASSDEDPAGALSRAFSMGEMN